VPSSDELAARAETRMTRSHDILSRYGTAALLAIGAIAVTRALAVPLAGAHFVLPLAAVFLSGLRGGIGPSLLAAALSVAGYFPVLSHEVHSYWIATEYHQYRIAPGRCGETLDEDTIRKMNPIGEAGTNFGKDGLRLAFNAILYIASGGADLKHRESERDRLLRDFSHHPKPTQAERRAHALARASHVRIHDAGYSIRIPHSPSVGVGATGASWRLGHRVAVRGHWRNQVVGEGRTGRKLMWIQPHYRGPEIAEVVQRAYDVGAGHGVADSGNPVTTPNPPEEA